MKVKFLDPKGNLPPSLLGLGYFPKVDLHLITGEIYTVFGVMIWKSVLHYLIIPTNLNLPNWLPADLFEIVDKRIPPAWYFQYCGDNDPSGFKFKLGYEELILDKDHSNNLIERDAEAIRTFFRRKSEMDESIP